jgi:ATP-dependent 26S proteasome regulatory subunit
MATVTTPAVIDGTTQAIMPPFIRAINDDYLAQVAHTFCLTGNIYDFVDNSGTDLGINKVLAIWYDDNIQADLGGAKAKHKDAGVQDSAKTSQKTRIVAFYNTSAGLEFPNPKSLKMWIEAHETQFTKQVVDDWGSQGKAWYEPNSPAAAMKVINRWFFVSRELQKKNNVARAQGLPLSMELSLTLIFTDADTLFPAGDIANLSQDREAIVYVRNWAQDKFVGDRNRIILMTRQLTDIHESIRGELAVNHTVRKPNLQDRLEWINNFDANIKKQVQQQGGKPLSIGQNVNVTGLVFAEEFDCSEFAIQSAGMNRRQIKDVILASWRNRTSIDFSLVQERKKRALEDEYGGMIDIKEPKFGFDQIGGHDAFKDYCKWHVIKPLKEGIKRLCSRGVLMTGPPGTGKSMIAWALAKEAGLNFIQVDLGKVFGGLVGETEKNVRKLLEAIEAASPCIVFIDEIDSVLSSGRSSAGDSGTSARVFNNLMTWLSDPSRVGKVVVVAATNRPDLLDSALIRMGRLDAIIPMLAPAAGDAKGRWSIVAALTKKLKLVLHPDLVTTQSDKTTGLGRLLHDKERIWTGAEMEAVLQSALQKAYRASRTWTDTSLAEEQQVNPKRKVFPKSGEPDLRLNKTDFDGAMNAIIPRTAEVALQTDLALYFANNLDYCPEDWRETARDKKALRDALLARDVDPARLSA